MIGVRSLTYFAEAGVLSIVFDDDAGSRIVVHGFLAAEPQQPTAGEFLRWDLLLRARPDPEDVQRRWATLSVEPPPEAPVHPFRPEWAPWM